MRKRNLSKIEKRISLIIVLLAVCMGAYVLIRSTYIGTIMDEARTISQYVSMSYSDVAFSVTSANNHVLNTLLMKLILSIYSSPNFFTLISRVPNILGYLLYAFYVFKITKEYQPIPRLLTASSLLFSPFILEFFGYARGYGLSIGLLMAAIYFLTSSRKHNIGNRAIGLLLLGLSTYANLTVIYAVPPILLYVLIEELIVNRKKTKIKDVVLKYLPFTLILPLIVQRFATVLESATLYDGLKSGYLYGTWSSILNGFAYDNQIIVRVFLVGLSLGFLTLLYSIYLDIGAKKMSSTKLLYLLISVVLPLEMVLNSLLLGTLYPIARTSYWIYIPTVLLIAELTKREVLVQRNLAKFSLAIIATASIITTVLFARFTTSYYWWYDVNSQRLASIINTLTISTDKEILIAADWYTGSSLAHYKDINNYRYSIYSFGLYDYQTYADAPSDPDYVVTYKDREDLNLTKELTNNYHLIQKFPDNGLRIWQKKDL